MALKEPTQRMVPAIRRFKDFDIMLPSLVEHRQKLAILLDYDGTLAPITDNPNKTAMSPEIERNLNRIAKHSDVFVAVISGRGLQDVKERIGIQGITYAGNHGLEIEYPDGGRHDYELPEDIKRAYDEMVREMRAQLDKEGAWVEDKRVTLTYHYRDTPEQLKDALKKRAVEIIERHGFRANQAHEAIEARPPVDWNKGEAALYILRHKYGKDFIFEVEAVFVGDDTTDEDAMRALQGKGYSLRITSDNYLKTYANYRLPSQALVSDFLKWIADAHVKE